jgi:putative oxidoreductase
VQRLFSSFADGWPGFGLLLLRLLAGGVLVHSSIKTFLDAPWGTAIVLQVIAAGVGLLLLAGLWTPVAGAVLAILKVSVAVSRGFSHSGDPWIPLMEAVFGAALAMIGPGAWSIDARLFGRKHIDFPNE